MYTVTPYKILPPRVKALSTSKRLEGLYAKLERWGPNSNLKSDIALAENLLEDYLIEAAGEALDSLHALQVDLDEYEDRKSIGILEDWQIDQGDAIKSYLGTLLNNRG